MVYLTLSGSRGQAAGRRIGIVVCCQCVSAIYAKKLAWFKKPLFWVAKYVTKPTNEWYKSQQHHRSLKTQHYFMRRV
jgi:hypothetical protein